MNTEKIHLRGLRDRLMQQLSSLIDQGEPRPSDQLNKVSGLEAAIGAIELMIEDEGAVLEPTYDQNAWPAQ